MNDEDLHTHPRIAEAVKPAIAAFIRNLDGLVESHPGLRPYVFRICRFLEMRDKECFPMQEGFLGGWFRHDGDMGTITLGDCRRLFSDADGLLLSRVWSRGIRVAVLDGPDDGACAAEAIREHPEDWEVLRDLFAGHRRGTELDLGHAGEDALVALLAATAAKRGLYLSAMDWSYATNRFVPDGQGWPSAHRLSNDPMKEAGLREAASWLRPSAIMDLGEIANSSKCSGWSDETNDLEAEYSSRKDLENEELYSDGEYFRMQRLFAVPAGVPLAPLPAPEDEPLGALSWRYHPLRDLSRAVAADPSIATRRGVAEEGTGDFWRTVLFHDPRLAPMCPVSRFDAGDWRILLSAHPELEHHPGFRWNRLDPGEIVDLLRANPKIAETIPVDWTRFDGGVLTILFIDRPRLLDGLTDAQFERMATCDYPTFSNGLDHPESRRSATLRIETLLDWTPELIDHPLIRRFLRRHWGEADWLGEVTFLLRVSHREDSPEQRLCRELEDRKWRLFRLQRFLEEDDRFRKLPLIRNLIRKHRRECEDGDDDDPPSFFFRRDKVPSPPTEGKAESPAPAPDTGAGWVERLRAHPEDGAACEWGKLGAEDWIRLLSSNPEWAWRPEWRRLVPEGEWKAFLRERRRDEAFRPAPPPAPRRGRWIRPRVA